MSVSKNSPFPPGTDMFSRRGAEMLKEHIVGYWTDRGYHGIKVEPYLIPRTDNVWGIKSNIGVTGYPPMSKVGRPRTTGVHKGYVPTSL